MIIKRGSEKTIVFGHGDVIVNPHVTKGVGFIGFHHNKEVLNLGEIVDDFGKANQDAEIILQFDKIESIDIIISDLKKIRKRMKEHKKLRVFSYNFSWEKTDS